MVPRKWIGYWELLRSQGFCGDNKGDVGIGVICKLKISDKMIKTRLHGSLSVMSDSVQPHGVQPMRLLCPWDSPGENTGVGCHFPLQGIFSTQVSNLHCQTDSLPLQPGKHHVSYLILLLKKKRHPQRRQRFLCIHKNITKRHFSHEVSHRRQYV